MKWIQEHIVTDRVLAVQQMSPTIVEVGNGSESSFFMEAERVGTRLKTEGQRGGRPIHSTTIISRSFKIR